MTHGVTWKNCACLELDRTGAYIHSLLPMPVTSDSTSPNDDEVSGEVEKEFTFNNDCGYVGVGRPGSIPFVSEKTGGIWPAVVSSICTMEDRAVDIL